MNSLDKKQIGYRIRLIRQEQGLTIEEFGNLFDASKGVISNWENGRNIPNNKRLKQIAELGNTSVEELMRHDNTITITATEYNELKEIERKYRMLLERS